MPIPAIAEVDDAVQLLADLLQKYMLVVKNAGLRVEPLITFDWAAPLRESWLPSPAVR